MKIILDIPIEKSFDILGMLETYPGVVATPFGLSDIQDFETIKTGIKTAAEIRNARFNRRRKSINETKRTIPGM